MHSAWKQAGMGRAHLVLIEGEAGIGKTRFAEEMASLALRQEAHVASAGCYQAERDLAYAPLVSWLRAAPLPPLDPMWLSEVARLLPEAQTLHPELPAPPPLADEWQRQRLFDALAHALLDRPRPGLLILDDAQWCDRQTLEWLHYLLRSHPRARLLVVATVRSEDLEPFSPFANLLSGLRRRQQLVEIGLGPLSLEESTELAIQSAEHPIQVEDAAALYQYTEGNPLFIIEMSRAGWLTAGHAAPEGTSIPLTLQSVIAERLAQLSASTRQLMELAAVIGREFSFPLLQSSSDMPDEALLVALDELWLRRIVRERGPDSYDFSHALLRQTAYAGISPMRRRLLHLRVARSWEALHESASPAAIIQAAYHYDQAQDWGAAVRVYQLACITAHQLYANSESIASSDRALEILETQVQRCTQEADKHPLWRTQAELLLERAWNWMLLGNMGTYQIDLDRLQILAERLQDVTINAQVIYRQALVDYHYCRFPSAREAAFRSVQLNQQTGNRREEGRALQLVGRIDMAVGDFENAAAHLLSARRIFAEIADPVLEVHTLSHLSTTYLYAGRPALAMQIAREALALCQQPNPVLVHRERIPLGDMGAAAIELGDYDRAEAWLEKSLELARRVRDNHQEAFCLGHLGWMRLSRSLAGEAYPLLSQALEISLASDLHIYRSWLLAGLAEYHLLCGDMQSARQAAHQSLELARRFTLSADLIRAEALVSRLDNQV
jgi:predicted ATPase